MFGLVSKKTHEKVLETIPQIERGYELKLLHANNMREEIAQELKKVKEQLKEVKELAEQQVKDLEELLSIEIEKTMSVFEAKEFGEEESLKQVTEACIEDVLEEVKSKIVISKEKEYSIHKITAKITIKDGN